jgi:hypothetical protein
MKKNISAFHSWLAFLADAKIPVNVLARRGCPAALPEN